LQQSVSTAAIRTVRTLSEVGSRADGNAGVVEGRSVGRREKSITAVALFYHAALITRLLARLQPGGTTTLLNS